MRPRLEARARDGSLASAADAAMLEAAVGEFERMLNGTHVPLHVSDIKELTEEDLVVRLQSSAGAHKPNRYDFSGKKGQDE